MTLLGKDIVQTPTITAGLYTTEDAVGGLLTFADVGFDGDAGNRIVYIDKVVITDLAKQNAALYLFLFNQTFTTTTNGDTLDIADADLPNCIGVISVTTYYNSNDSSVGVAKGLNDPIVLSGGDSLYGQLKVVGAPTYASTTDLQVRVTVLKG